MPDSFRYLFPLAYGFLLLPTALHSAVAARVVVLVACPVLAFAINSRTSLRMLLLLGAAIGTLVPLLIIVQGAVCSSSGMATLSPLVDCAFRRSLGTLLNAVLLSSILLLAAANEWRGSLIATVNGLHLPRNMRIVGILSGAMIGEFRRAAIRVHQAFTGRGEAMPSLSWRNIVVLPSMLGMIWAAVLNGAAERMHAQWSSDAFWNTYVPAGRKGGATRADLVVLAVCGIVIALSLSAIIF